MSRKPDLQLPDMRQQTEYKGSQRASPAVPRPPKKEPDLAAKLKSMEEYCKKANVFFSDDERIQHAIRRSRGLFQEFTGALNRACKDYKEFVEHPKL